PSSAWESAPPGDAFSSGSGQTVTAIRTFMACHALPLEPASGVEQGPKRRGVVRHDAVGAELEQPRSLGAGVDGPKIDARTEAVALGDDRLAGEVDATLLARHRPRRAGER